MRSFGSISVALVLVALSACSKPSDSADTADTTEGAGSAGAAAVGGGSSSPTPAPGATPPAPGMSAGAEFPSKEELTALIDAVKELERRQKAGDLKPEEIQAFMIESQQNFPRSSPPPRELLESDPEYQAAQVQFVEILKSVPREEMIRSPEKQKEVSAKAAPLTLTMMRRTFEVLKESGWQPPPPGAAPSPAPPAPPAAPAPPVPGQ